MARSDDAGSLVVTPRLQVRPPTEADRGRFVELFCDEAFMVFAGPLSPTAAHNRFDGMLRTCEELTFAKQPVIERSTGVIIGYTGVDWFEFEGNRRLEYGYRLTAEARGVGYATEASAALLERATETFHGEVLAIIDPINHASHKVSRKLGFTFWKQALVDACLRNIYRIHINAARPLH